MVFLPPANEVSVILFTGGMHASPPPARIPPGHAHTTPGMYVPRRILRDAVNERAVRILLECILVMTRTAV